MRVCLSCLLFAGAISSALAASDPVPDSEQICTEAKTTKLPQPSLTAKVDKDCDSEKLYYGIGRPADPQAARVCALRHLADGTGKSPMEDAGMLATIYANGRGASRDYDVAIAYACRIDGARAEIEGRIAHLARLKRDGPDKEPFDICDDITSGLMMGFCAKRASDLETAQRNAKLSLLIVTLDPRRKATYAKLRATENAFAKTLSENEVDLSGTARAAFEIEDATAHHEAFAALLEAALAGKVPMASPAAYADADKALNATYARVMAQKDMSKFGTVDTKGIRVTQRAWLAYRDAFMTFAQKGPTTPQSVGTALTRERLKNLEAFADEP